MRRAVIAFSIAGVLIAATAGSAAANVLSPSSYNFGTVATNASSSPIAFALYATTHPAQPNPQALGGNGSWQVSSHNCPALLPLGQSCTISVAFKPIQSGLITGTLATNNAIPAGSVSEPTAQLSGMGLAPARAGGKRKKCKKKRSASAAKKKCKKKH